ncbi:STAS domain-containing protein [Amycolatopsis alkalitolerans]|uniref:Anti-sigma factor antagonist n=1 Tax=Amycolatopsis alkalitolerans TaxID=2547244 RepID=A0A5C4LPK2_9PSEU|nr:STAS domain-containing protein [Amycolatopsis alkalitolerans]TNC19604.1 STAS domain-containing protein [Amycolatopsis alkalitolerans]
MRRDEDIHSSTPVRVELDGEIGRIRLHGEIDHTAVEQLDRAVAELLDKGVGSLVVDFADLSFFDSACVSALVRARALAEERGSAITLANVDRYARRILDLTGLSAAFRIED